MTLVSIFSDSAQNHLKEVVKSWEVEDLRGRKPNCWEVIRLLENKCRRILFKIMDSRSLEKLLGNWPIVICAISVSFFMNWDN